MDIVEWYPAAVEVESSGPNVASGHLGPHGAAARNAAEIAVAGRVLCAFEFGKHIVETSADFLISRGGIHVGESRQIVAADMAVETCIFPVGVVFGFRFESGFLEIGREQTVGVYFEEISEVEILGMSERALGEAHIFSRKSCDRRIFSFLDSGRVAAGDRCKSDHGQKHFFHGNDFGFIWLRGMLYILF